MKKKLICLFLALLCLTFSACGKTPASENAEGTFPEVPIETEPETEAPVLHGDYTFDIQTLTKTIESQKLSLACPHLMPEEDYSAVNQTIREDMEAKAERFLRYSTDVDFPGEYVIDGIFPGYLGEKFASFLCTGYYAAEGADHPELIVFSLNMDLTTGKLLSFEETVADFDALAAEFCRGKFTLLPGSLLKEGEFSPADLLAEEGSLYGIYPTVSFRENENEMLFVFSVELPYALGGHAEFGLPLSEAADSLTEAVCSLLIHY